MNQSPIAYKADVEYKNNLELLDIVMEIFSVTVVQEQLSKREKTILRDYMKDGYSKSTKTSLKLSLGISWENINTLNHTLQNKGFLVPHKTNKRLKVLNEDLIKMRDCFLQETQGKKLFLINFVKNENT